MSFTSNDWFVFVTLLGVLALYAFGRWIVADPDCTPVVVPWWIRFCDRLCVFLTVSGIVLLIAGDWLSAVKDSQFAPHHITARLGAVNLVDFWTTNPAYISYSNESLITSTGLVRVDVPLTNYYWHVWPIFKK